MEWFEAREPGALSAVCGWPHCLHLRWDCHSHHVHIVPCSEVHTAKGATQSVKVDSSVKETQGRGGLRGTTARSKQPFCVATCPPCSSALVFFSHVGTLDDRSLSW